MGLLKEKTLRGELSVLFLSCPIFEDGQAEHDREGAGERGGSGGFESVCRDAVCRAHCDGDAAAPLQCVVQMLGCRLSSRAGEVGDREYADEQVHEHSGDGSGISCLMQAIGEVVAARQEDSEPDGQKKQKAVPNRVHVVPQTFVREYRGKRRMSQLFKEGEVRCLFDTNMF